MKLPRPAHKTRPAAARSGRLLITGGCYGAATVFVLVALLVGCSGDARAAGTPTSAPAVQDAIGVCVVDDDPPTSIPQDAPLSRLQAKPTSLNAGIGHEGDSVTVDQVITDFPIPPRALSPREAIVLASVTVQPKASGPRPNRSVSMTAIRPAGGSVLVEHNCPLSNPDVTAAMRATRHQPLPEKVADGQQVSGWLAFSVNRDSAALLLRVQVGDDSGYGNSDAPVLLRKPAP